MAHKTLIGGTAYEISGGKTLVGGTAYEISGGKTLVGGTAYEVGFDNGMRTITLYGGTGTYDLEVVIGGTLRYVNNGYLLNLDTFESYDWTSPATIEVPIGTEIVFTVTPASYGASYEVILNGSTVDSGYVETKDNANYYYTVTKNVTLVMSESWLYSLAITEE